MTYKPGRLKLWARIVVHGLQSVFAATLRRLEQFDQRLLQETAGKETQEPPASGSEGSPPAHWLARVRGGPPAHWLEDIRRRAADPDRLETFDVTVQSPEPEHMPPVGARGKESRGERAPAEASASRIEARREESRGERAPAMASASRFGRFIQPIVAVRRAELPQADTSEKTRAAPPPGAPVPTARSQPLPTYNQPDTARRDSSERPPSPWPALADETRRRAPIAEPDYAQPVPRRGDVQEPQRAAAPEAHTGRIPPEPVLLWGEQAFTPRTAGSDLRQPAPNVWPELPPDNWPVVDDDAAAQREHLQQLQREQEGSR